MTNVDRIRSMNDEELAKIVMCPKDICRSWKYNGVCNYHSKSKNKGIACSNCKKAWLNAPA